MHKNNLKKHSELAFLKNINMYILLSGSFVKWTFMGTIVGILSGLVATLFLKSLEIATSLRLGNSCLLFLLPIGGAFISFLYSKYGKNSSKGNNLILDNINNDNNDISLRMAPLVFLGTFITHLFGGSAGREGTGVQIGSCISEFIGRLFKLNKIDRKIILMCGISSGFGSVFGTPLAGTLFGLEVTTLGIMRYEAIIPCLTSAFIGNLVTEFLGVHHVDYSIPTASNITYIFVLKIIIAAILFGLVSKLFSELTHKLKEIFSCIFKNTSIKSFVGGLIIILLTYIVGTRDYLGLSLPLMSDSFNTDVSPFAFINKIIFTSITLGSGFQGGEVTPLFVIGSTFGNTLANIIHISPALLGSLGLIGVFAGATNSPITSFVLGLEMFGSQNIELMFITCIISYLFSGHSGIYLSQKVGINKAKAIKPSIDTTLGSYRKNNDSNISLK